MPASDTEIANDALGRLGISPIMELSDDSKQAQFAKRFFDQTREEVLAARPWTFAIKRQNLSQLSTAPISEWQYAYQLPSDFLRLVQINNDEIETIKFKYAIEGRTIVTDENPITICYVARVTDPTLYSPLFSEAFALKLASKLVGPLTGALKLSMDYLALYEKAITTPQVGEQQGRAKRDKGTAFNAVEIANTALVMLGAPPITSFSDASTQAQLAERLYDLTRDEVLESRPWTFATKRSTLTRASNPTGSEWLYSYTLPSDYLRLIQINKDEVATIQNKYAIEGNKLLTDEASVEAIYVARITDATLYSPLFVETLTTKFALKMAGPLLQGQKPDLIRTLMLSLEKLTTTPQSGEALKRANRKQSATVDEVEIVNMSLAMLGVSPIVSMLDPSASAQLANRFYAQTVDEVLETRVWQFATKRQPLIRMSNAAGSEYAYRYALPLDFIRLVQINNDEIDAIQHKYTIEGFQLFTDEEEVDVVYVARITDATFYSPLFVEMLVAKLALKLSGPIHQGQKPDLTKLLLVSYEKLAVTPQAGEKNRRSNRSKGTVFNSVEIANLSLAMIGADPIVGFSDQSIQAQLCDRFYTPTRDEVLESRNWTFAIKRATLTGTANSAFSEWAYTYTLPSDYLRLIQIDKDEVETIQSKYALEGNKLLSDRVGIEICYVAKVTQVDLYSPLFVEALATKLAIKLAGPLQKPDMVKQLFLTYAKIQETPQAGEQRKRTNRVVGAGITSLEIANNALAMLGVTPITSFGDQSIQAQLADRFYEPTRDEVMVSHPWNFAIRRSNLNASATAPLFEWEKSYDLPADCIRVLQLNNYDPAISIQSYAVEAGKVMTNEPTAQIKYVARVTDTAGYPPLFVESLTVKLATKLAGPLGKMEMIGMLTEQYERLTGPKARLMDVFEAKEKTRIAWIDSRIVRSRRTGIY